MVLFDLLQLLRRVTYLIDSLQVLRSVTSLITRRQVVELPVNQGDFWFAEVILPSGQFLGLRYVDDNFTPTDDDLDTDQDLMCHLWLDVLRADVKPLGW